MAELRFKGFTPSTAVNLSDVTIGSDSGSVNVASFLAPPAVSGLPRVNTAQDASVTAMGLDTSGLTGISAYDWREVGGATLGTSATLDATPHGGKWVECEVTCNEGVLVSPAVMIYRIGMMPGHDIDDLAALAAFKHSDATHIAVANGLSSSAATWLNGEVPSHGARVLVPHGLTVTYDEDAPKLRLDWLRVDGTVERSLTKSTTMLVETILVTRGATWKTGDAQNRLPAEHTARVVFSDRDYATDALQPTDIDISRDTRLWGRGLVCQGTWTEWGAFKDGYVEAKEKRSTFNGTYYEFPGVNAGDTSVFLKRAPIGWNAGDTIIIPSTTEPNHPYHDPGPMADYNEERVITAINGNEISFDMPLLYDHDNQLAGSTRSDLFPHIALKEARNISYESECTDLNTAWRRAHSVSMHHHSKTDLWGVQFINMGRTDKRNNDGGVIDSNGDFHNVDKSTGDFKHRPLDARAKLISRYSQHFHHVGTNNGKDASLRPIISDCYVGGSVGWAFVHHGSDADYVRSVAYEFAGAGFVAESGNETGVWRECMAVKATTATPRIAAVPKIMQGPGGAYGDPFQWGYGMAFRSRAIRHIDNIVAGCPWGHVWHHRAAGRASVPGAMAFVGLLDRTAIDLGTAGQFAQASQLSAYGLDKMSVTDYPLHLTQGNIAYGCIGGWHISKHAPNQKNIVNTRLKDFTAWGIERQTTYIEYIGQYVVDGFDMLGTGTEGAQNVMQFSIINQTTEGGYGVRLSGATTENRTDVWTVDDPRYMIYGLDTDNVSVDVSYHSAGAKTFDQIGIYEPDPQSNILDFSLDPSHTFPRKLGDFTYNSGAGSVTNALDNTGGYRVDNISALGEIMPQKSTDNIFNHSPYALNKYLSVMGHNTYDDGGGLKDILIQEEVISDRATGRPAKTFWYYECHDINTTQTAGSNGEVFFSNNPVVQSDMTSAGAVDTDQVVNVVAGATGGNGTIKLDIKDYINPRHGHMVLDEVAGTITFKPDAGWAGTDEAFVFIRSDYQFKTVRIDFLVGENVSPVTPVGGTNFIAFNHPTEANTIGVQLLDRPDIGDRKFFVTEYSTDAGASWSRLCFGWKRKVHKVTVESDGLTAIGVGAYGLRIRYRTDYDKAVSSASADDVVTVS